MSVMTHKSFEITTTATGDPVTYQEARIYLRVDADDEQSLITSLITVATRSSENFTNRLFMRQTAKARYDWFPREIILPRSPVQSVSSITFIAATGNTATLATTVYQVDTQSEPARIMPTASESWPSTQADTYNVVTVTFIGGYATATTDLATKVPDGLKTAIKWQVNHMHENREPVVVGVTAMVLPESTQNLLWQFRVPEAV